MMGSPSLISGAFPRCFPPSQDPPCTPVPYSNQTGGTHMHVGLDPIAGKPADFIGRRIPSLKDGRERWTERLQAATMLVYPSFTPTATLLGHLSP